MDEDHFWSTLETLSSDCIQRYEAIRNDIKDGKLLSQIELVMLQHQLYKDVCETSLPTNADVHDQTEMSAFRILESRLAALKKKQYTILITGYKLLFSNCFDLLQMRT